MSEKYYVHISFSDGSSTFDDYEDMQDVVDAILGAMPCHYTVIHGTTMELSLKYNQEDK